MRMRWNTPSYVFAHAHVCVRARAYMCVGTWVSVCVHVRESVPPRSSNEPLLVKL